LINAGVKQEIIIFADILAQDDNAQDEPEPSTYLFRRSFATYSRYYCGFTVSELKYIMGHKDDSVDLPLYQVYCTNENQEEIKTKLEKWQVGTYTPGQKITPEDRTEEKQDEETSVLAKTSATNDDNQRDQILTTEEPDDDFNDNLMPTSEQPGDDYNDHQIPGNYIFLLTSEGRIRKTPISEYPRRSRNTSGVKGPDFKNNDYFTSGIKVSELDNIYVITDKGNIYLLSMLNIPVTNRTNIAKTATENIFKKNSEKIMIAIHDNRSIDNEECYLTTVTRFGRIQRTNVKFLKKLKPYSKDSDPAGIKLMTLNDGDSIVSAFFSKVKSKLVCKLPRSSNGS
jgi:DNA gyrase/topoisomerase IV subunit A